MKATYNITNDKLKAWFDARLNSDDYAAVTAAGFTFWHGSKCFVAKWNPEAEDLLKAHGFTIEEDDTPDDVEARVQRFGGYAAQAENSAASAQNYLESDRANTERRRENAANAINRNLSEAEHWNRRIARAIRHAQRKESPGVIARRIQELEKDLRWHELRAAAPSDEAGKRYKHEDGSVSFWVGHSRGGGWVTEKDFPAMNERARRCVAHIENRLIYERACLADTGSIQAEMAAPGGLTIEKGGAITLDGSLWYYVTKVNPSTVEAYDARTHWNHYRKIDKTTIKGIATADQVKAGGLLISLPPADELAALEAPKTVEKAMSRDGKRPEKFGAFGSSDGFVDRIETARWFLITKVNAKTVEFLSSQDVLTNGEKSVRYYINKREIARLTFVKSAEEVKAQHPELLAAWAKVEEIRARNEARKAAAQAAQSNQNEAAAA